MDLQILDYSIYGNPCDLDSDRLLVRAAQRQGLSACVTALPQDVPVAPVARMVWLRFDLRCSGELSWIVDLAAKLERAQKRVFPTAPSLRMSEDKWETYSVLSQAGVPTVMTYGLSHIRRCGSKAVVKPRVGWGGMRMRVVDDTQHFEPQGDEADDGFVCQPYIAHEQTWTIAAAAGDILACIEKSVGQGDFRTNELHGGTTRLARPPAGAAALALAALRAVDLTAGTVDLLLSPGGVEVLEVNAAPGLHYPGIPQLDLAGPIVRAVLARMGQP